MVVMFLAVVAVAYSLPYFKSGRYRIRPTDSYDCPSVCASKLEYCDVMCKQRFGAERPWESVNMFSSCLESCAEDVISCLSGC